MADRPDETQRRYRVTALLILDAMQKRMADDHTTVEEHREALLYLAEALVALAETMMEGHLVAGTSGH
jgi:hypothetical protein